MTASDHRPDLQGMTAFVTGASRGIGEAAARSLVAAGANVALVARSAADIERLAMELGDQTLALTCDVADWTSVQAAVGQTVSHFGSLDILVNNAGLIDPIARIEDADPEAWGEVIDVNLKGCLHTIRAALPGMKARGQGVVINISSGAATGAMEGWSHYCTSKAAALSLTKCLHREEAGNNIRCVGLSPGTVATEMQKSIKASGINPVSTLDWSAHIPPEWVGQAIAWLATDAARSYDGDDVSLRDPDIREAIGLTATAGS